VSLGGTGISFVDAALRRQLPDTLPIVEIRGDYGKTWTLVSLAARFVAATRPSQFPATTMAAPDENIAVPQVIVIDSTWDITPAKLAYTVRSTLLRQMASSLSTTADEESLLLRDMQDCLSRIHVATASHTSEWVPILELIRQELAPTASDHPTLVLWDGFLLDGGSNNNINNSNNSLNHEAGRMEIIRQLARLVEECSVVLVTTTSSNRKSFEWEKYITHRIKLQRNISARNEGHEYIATVQGAQIPFSITLSGILS